MKRYKEIHVDLPTGSTSQASRRRRVHTLTNATREEAVEWVRRHVDECSDDGWVEVLEFGEEVPESRRAELEVSLRYAEAEERLARELIEKWSKDASHWNSEIKRLAQEIIDLDISSP